MIYSLISFRNQCTASKVSVSVNRASIRADVSWYFTTQEKVKYLIEDIPGWNASRCIEGKTFFRSFRYLHDSRSIHTPSAIPLPSIMIKNLQPLGDVSDFCALNKHELGFLDYGENLL